MNCKHCKTRPINKSSNRRGLCHHCFDDPAIRTLHPLPSPWPPEQRCQHCKFNKIGKPKNMNVRKLCHSCFEDSGVRDKFPLPTRHLSPTSKTCVHCAERKPNWEHGGLCSICSSQPALLAKYKPSAMGNRGAGNEYRNAPLPPSPTNEMPGTEGKIRVMEERLAAGYSLHHPADARWDTTDKLNGAEFMEWLGKAPETIPAAVGEQMAIRERIAKRQRKTLIAKRKRRQAVGADD